MAQQFATPTSSQSDPSSLIRGEAHTDAQAFVNSALAKDLANLSEAAYVPGGAGTVDEGVPDGFTLLPRFTVEAPDTGFAAYAYQGPDGNITVAIRGTDLDTASANVGGADLTADLGFIVGSNPVLGSDVAQTVSMIQELRAAYPAAQITLTGDSLGGGIADIVAAGSGLNAVTFNAPQVHSVLSTYAGIAQSVASGVPQPVGHDNIVNIQASSDPISHFPLGGQVGEVITIHTPFTATLADPLADHSISAITQQLQSPSGATVTAVAENPSAPQELGTFLLQNAGGAEIMSELASSLMESGKVGGSPSSAIDNLVPPGGTSLFQTANGLINNLSTGAAGASTFLHDF
jgi:hypothetical protein